MKGERPAALVNARVRYAELAEAPPQPTPACSTLVEKALLKASDDCQCPAMDTERSQRSGLEAGMSEPRLGSPEKPDALEDRQRCAMGVWR